MKLKVFVKNIIREYVNQRNVLNENTELIDNILDKINKSGRSNLSYDEREYLKQYNNNNINIDLENWLLNDDDSTFSKYGEKLLYDEYEQDEDIFYNYEKLKRVLTKHLKKTPFTNNADWGGGFVWGVKTTSNSEGIFFYLGDDELVLLKRKIINDEYQDQIIKTITNTKDLHNSLLWINKNIMSKEMREQINKIKNFEEILNEQVEVKQPITIKSKKNDLFFIKIHFDNKGRVDKIENKWDVKLPEWYGYDINEIEINNWINKKGPEFYIEKDINENTSKIAFDDEIKYELKRYLQNTVWNKVGGIDDRVGELMGLHNKFINNVRDKMSANEIAKRLFEYEKNILNRE
jgi:hypothetical protein